MFLAFDGCFQTNVIALKVPITTDGYLRTDAHQLLYEDRAIAEFTGFLPVCPTLGIDVHIVMLGICNVQDSGQGICAAIWHYASELRRTPGA